MILRSRGFIWRRRRDLNSRADFSTYSLSRGAPSPAWVRLHVKLCSFRGLSSRLSQNKWRNGWDSFSAENPRRLQHTTGMLPRAAFRIPPTTKNSKRAHPVGWALLLAEWVGFEPTVPLPVHLISSQGRYNHFDTTPYELALVLYQQARAKSRVFLRKLRECFLRRGNASCFCCKRGVHRRRAFCGKMSEISVANSHFRCYSRQAPRACAARI